MFSLNRVQLIGYQTQPLSLRQTPQGTNVLDLNLVVPYRFRPSAPGAGEEVYGATLEPGEVLGAFEATQPTAAGAQRDFVFSVAESESYATLPSLRRLYMTCTLARASSARFS